MARTTIATLGDSDALPCQAGTQKPSSSPVLRLRTAPPRTTPGPHSNMTPGSTVDGPVTLGQVDRPGRQHPSRRRAPGGHRRGQHLQHRPPCSPPARPRLACRSARRSWLPTPATLFATCAAANYDGRMVLAAWPRPASVTANPDRLPGPVDQREARPVRRRAAGDSGQVGGDRTLLAAAGHAHLVGWNMNLTGFPFFQIVDSTTSFDDPCLGYLTFFGPDKRWADTRPAWRRSSWSTGCR